eukprot:Gb_01977 [translate_table: standard]
MLTRFGGYHKANPTDTQNVQWDEVVLRWGGGLKRHGRLELTISLDSIEGQDKIEPGNSYLPTPPAPSQSHAIENEPLDQLMPQKSFVAYVPEPVASFPLRYPE